MTNDHAKFVLSAYRSDGADATDPTFQEALAHASRDPELAKWLEGERAFDQKLKTAVGTIGPPDYLLQAIRAGLRTGPKRARWLPWLAAAAILTLGSIFLTFTGIRHPDPNRNLLAFRQDALGILSESRGPQLDFRSTDLGATQRFITDHQGPAAPDLPVGLRGMPTAGCRVLDWRKQQVSLTCFWITNDELLHLLVIARSAFGDRAIPDGFQTIGSWHVLFRQQGGYVLMWASEVPMDRLKQALSI